MQAETEYHQALFEFYTQPDNFRTMQQVVEHHEKIYHRVLDDFWRAVETELRQQLNEREDGCWTVHRSQEDLQHPYCKILAIHRDWCVPENGNGAVAVAFEQLYWKWDPFVGVFVGHDHDEFPERMLREALQAERAFAKYSTDDNEWWSCFTHLESVNAKDRLSEILPDTRQGWVDNFVQEALILVELLQPIAPRVIAACRK